MSKAEYTVEDFLLDPEFRSWILKNHPDSKIYWEDFMARHPDRVPDIELARKILVHLSKEKNTLPASDKGKLWEGIVAQLAKMPEAKKETKVIALDSWTAIQHYNQEKARKTKVAWKRKVAAAILLTGFIGYFFSTAFINEEPHPVQTVAEIETHQAPPGVKSAITLEDGSKVFLNSGSRISYVKGFTDTLRHLELEGEAFFEVAHDEDRPFVVQTGSIFTTALGTSFNISSFPGDSISISLVSGQVLINKENSTANEKLIPGERILASASDLTWKKVRFDQDRVLSWMDKTIIFDKMPFEKAAQKLENWYGVEIHFKNSVPADLSVSGKFRDESLENILTGLSYSSRFDYTLQGKNVIIQFKP